MTLTTIVLFIHAATTIFMTGLIWFVQAVHYPLMAQVGQDRFAEFQHRHMRLTTWVVVLPMWVELGTTIFLVYALWNTPARGMALLGAGLIVIIWISTFALQVPCHRALATGFQPGAHRRLVRTNWTRTIAWSIRAGLAVYLLTMAGTL